MLEWADYAISKGKATQKPVVPNPKPLFVPLKTEFYDAFCEGSKDTEFRRYGKRWNENTCPVGRRVTLSKGYGKQNRRHGRIVGFEKRFIKSKAFVSCYGEPGWAACIKIKLDTICQCCGVSICVC